MIAKMEEKPKPAPYSTTDEQETLAIDIFERLIDHQKVKADVKKRDKYPNIDGYVELMDDFRSPIAKLEVQIRKIAENGGKPKVQVPLSLFSSARAKPTGKLLLFSFHHRSLSMEKTLTTSRNGEK